MRCDSVLARSAPVLVELSSSDRPESAVKLFWDSWSLGTLRPIPISAADLLLTKQLLCQLSLLQPEDLF